MECLFVFVFVFFVFFFIVGLFLFVFVRFCSLFFVLSWHWLSVFEFWRENEAEERSRAHRRVAAAPALCGGSCPSSHSVRCAPSHVSSCAMSAASSSPTIELGAASGSTPESADFSGEDVAAAATAAAASCSPGGTVVNGALLRTELRKRQSIRSQQVIATGDRPNVALRRRRKGEPAAKVDRRTTATNGAPRISFHNLYGEADDLEQFRKAGACSKCVDTFFGTTPPPKPCGSCGYQIRWMMSGLFIALLKYVFAITCAHMIHESEDVFKPSISIGVNIQLMCMVVSQLMLAPFTNIGVTIGGPDVVAAIFASAEAHIIAEETHDHPEKALPTLLFCMGLTTFCCSVVWLLIGYFKAARIVDYMPVCVVCGFLGCLAYKVRLAL